MNIIEELKTEHVLIKEFMPIFHSMVMASLRGEAFDLSRWRTALDFLSLYVDKYHHGKEEEILFPVLHTAGLANQGGPNCSFFLHFRNEYDFLNLTKADIRKHQMNFPEYQLRPELESIVADKSPLKIPLEDHEMGFYSMQILNAELENLYEGRNEVFCRIALRYLDMLRLHVRKEDECLFCRVLNLSVPDNTQDLLLEFNRKNDDFRRQGESKMDQLRLG